MPITTNRIDGNSATIKVGDVDIQVTSDPQAKSGPVINIRSNRGPAQVNYGNMGSGMDVNAFARTPKAADPTPAAPVAAPAPAKKAGFFSRIGSALTAPFRWAAGLGEKSKFGAKTMGTVTGAATTASAVATGAFVTNMVAPQVMHGLLLKVGMLTLLGPQSAALIPAIAFGALTIGLGIAAYSFFKGAKTPPPPDDQATLKKLAQAINSVRDS